MAIATITAKGQITLRKEVLRTLGVKPGDKVSVEITPTGKVELGALRKKQGLNAFFGSLHRPGEPTKSLEEINEIVRKGWAGEL
ncbi:AbrB/MazE/SpoVT family DNA-binding domain-containing protein [Mesorhizobium sp. ASY16-5R]|uniref:AbrB/MazE/SpoVT family DNA-binding domain-containing protein n=1 Tax=Mesorhizobium sp. ASY16-5R TaxID=3445772 RepID=UPI003FA0AFD1